MAPPQSTERFIALSCSNVGVGPGGTTSMLARVVLVDYKGQVLFDQFVGPTTQVTDYRSSTTGITEAHLVPGNVWPFVTVQRHVAGLIEGRVIVGHSIWQDLSVLGIPHPAANTRDVALYMPFRNALRAQGLVGLQTLAWQLMGRRCQEGQHHPLENARAALDLYRSHAEEWERAISKDESRNLPDVKESLDQKAS